MTCSCCAVERHIDASGAMPGFASFWESVVWEQVYDLCSDLATPLANQCGVALVKLASIGGLRRLNDRLLDVLAARAMVANLLEAYDVSLTTVWIPCHLPVSSTTTMSPALLCTPRVPAQFCPCALIVSS